MQSGYPLNMQIKKTFGSMKKQAPQHFYCTRVEPSSAQLRPHLALISHAHCISFEKKYIKTDGCDVREQAQISMTSAPKLSPGGTIFGSVLVPHIPK